MRTGTVFFNGRNLNRLGKPTVRIDRRPDPEPPAMATRQAYNITLEFAIDRMSASNVHSVIDAFDRVFSRSEGILRIEDETGYAREWLAMVRNGKPNDALRGTSNTYVVELTSYVPLINNDIMGHGATFLPTGGSIVYLHSLRDLNEVMTTERHFDRTAGRKLTTTSISFTARIFHADQSLSHSDRMAQLQEQAQLYRSMNAKDGLLTMPSHQCIVQIQEWRPIIDERREVLDLSVQCRRYDLPGELQCEANLTRTENTDVTTGEITTSIRGSIHSEEKESALARMNAIKITGMSQGSRLTKFNYSTPEYIGGDSDYEEEWGGFLEFEMEYRNRSGQCLGYELKIANEKEMATNSYRVSYTGFVTADTLQDAENKARELGANKHPICTRISETSTEISTQALNDSGTPDCQKTFTRLEFAYDYEKVPDAIEAEFTMTQNNPTYGDRTASVSGSFTVANRQLADSFQEAIIRSLIPGMSNTTAEQREDLITAYNSTETIIAKSNSQQLLRRSMDFSYRIFNRGNRAHLKYNRSETINYTTLVSDISAAGTIWADNETKARQAFQQLKNELQLQRITQEKTSTDIERAAGERINMISFSFELSAQNVVAETPGIDILEAQWSLTRIGQINHAILTEIPQNYPVAQTNMGWTIGTLRVQGSVRAKSQASAKTWAQQKIALVISANSTPHEISPPEETISPTFIASSGTDIASWTFQFSYSRSYASGLENLW